MKRLVCSKHPVIAATAVKAPSKRYEVVFEAANYIYKEWCENLITEIWNDDWYRKTSSRERILEQIKEFAEDLMYYYNSRERPEDIAGRWWAITL